MSESVNSFQITNMSEITDSLQKFDIIVNVHGGGLSGQAGAIRHGISRALLLATENSRDALKKAGMLTRDSRKVERKKYYHLTSSTYHSNVLDDSHGFSEMSATEINPFISYVIHRFINIHLKQIMRKILTNFFFVKKSHQSSKSICVISLD